MRASKDSSKKRFWAPPRPDPRGAAAAPGRRPGIPPQAWVLLQQLDGARGGLPREARLREDPIHSHAVARAAPPGLHAPAAASAPSGRRFCQATGVF